MVEELINFFRVRPEKAMLPRGETFDLQWLLCLVSSEGKGRFELSARFENEVGKTNRVCSLRPRPLCQPLGHQGDRRTDQHTLGDAG